MIETFPFRRRYLCKKMKEMTTIRTIVLVLAFMTMPSATIIAGDYMSLLDQVDRALAGKDWTLSEQLIKTALEMEPANPSNYLLMSNLGTVYRNQGKLGKSLECYNMALSVAPKSTTILHNRAALFLEMDSVQLALADYTKLLDINSSDCSALSNVGMIALEVGDMEQAERCFDKCLNADAGNMDAKRGMALLRRLTGEYDKSISLYDDIIKKENRPGNYLSRAECYIAVGRFQEAQNDLSEAQKLDPKSADLYLLKARLAQIQFRYDDACAYAMEAIELGCDKSLASPYLKKKER